MYISLHHADGDGRICYNLNKQAGMEIQECYFLGQVMERRGYLYLNKIGFVLSFVLADIGCIFLFITNLMQHTIPIIGKMASQLSNTQKYGELMYLPNLNIFYVISHVTIVVGIALCIFFFRREKKC